MSPCCFGRMLLALHARLQVLKFEGGVGNKGLIKVKVAATKQGGMN